MEELSHTDDQGKARMVDVGHKPDQLRIARAIGQIKLKTETIQLIRDNEVKKGDVLAIAEIAGIQGGKKTSELIPLCHPLPITKMHVMASLADDCVIVESEARCTGKTGIEMEALTAVNIALLTIYDMCKAVDDGMEIYGVRLVEKTKEDIE
ncbi:MAG: cyclic pyranopterin monophosphate synthase MoaC [Bacteroidota bacterium]|nr:cyclic pyranopterin monophosphate synthase MoaC [Bacteroidota bacterium]